MVNLMKLEWKKLKYRLVIVEIIIYWLILMAMPWFFINVVTPAFGQSYAVAIELNQFIQFSMVLFGGSLISQVFIEEFKNKTIALSYGYPISRKKLFTAKVLLIALLVFSVTLISFILTGLATYFLDQAFPLINGDPAMSDIRTYLTGMVTWSFATAFVSFIPLFVFGIWRRGTISTVICSVIIMQLPKLAPTFNFEVEVMLAVLTILGLISIYLSIRTAESAGEI